MAIFVLSLNLLRIIWQNYLGWLDGWMDGWMDVWVDGWIYFSIC